MKTTTMKVKDGNHLLNAFGSISLIFNSTATLHESRTFIPLQMIFISLNVTTKLT